MITRPVGERTMPTDRARNTRATTLAGILIAFAVAVPFGVTAVSLTVALTYGALITSLRHIARIAHDVHQAAEERRLAEDGATILD